MKKDDVDVGVESCADMSWDVMKDVFSGEFITFLDSIIAEQQPDAHFDDVMEKCEKAMTDILKKEDCSLEQVTLACSLLLTRLVTGGRISYYQGKFEGYAKK